MAAQEPVSDALSKVSKVSPDLSQEDRLEYAAFGVLVDWEILKLLRDQGYEMTRLSFGWREDEVLMVVKLVADDTPYVVFVSRSSPVHCIRTFVRRAREGTLKLNPDRFA